MITMNEMEFVVGLEGFLVSGILVKVVFWVGNGELGEGGEEELEGSLSYGFKIIYWVGKVKRLF